MIALNNLNDLGDMRGKEFLFLLIPFLLFIACDRIEGDPSGDELARFNAWIDVNNIEAIADTVTPDGLYYINQHEGTGLAPTDSSYLIYSCTVRNLDDHLYVTTDSLTADLYGIYSHSTHYVPVFSLYLSNSFYPVGLREGLKMMKEGGKARLIMSSNLAYGKSGSGPIPSYESLIYDVELIKVVTDPLAYEQTQITEFLNNNPGFTLYHDSIYIRRDVEGIRDCIVADDSMALVYYTGRYLDNIIFDTNIKSVAIENGIYSSSKSYSQLTFSVGSSSVVSGFNLAVKQMIEKEKITVLIPSTYAYGKNGSKGGSTVIYPYTPLIFEITLDRLDPKPKY